MARAAANLAFARARANLGAAFAIAFSDRKKGAGLNFAGASRAALKVSSSSISCCSAGYVCGGDAMIAQLSAIVAVFLVLAKRWKICRARFGRRQRQASSRTTCTDGRDRALPARLAWRSTEFPACRGRRRRADPAPLEQSRTHAAGALVPNADRLAFAEYSVAGFIRSLEEG